jgi:hypothetical protein
MKRAWTSITSERTRIKREQLADEISRIPDEQLRANLQQTMSRLFLSLEDDLEHEQPASALPVKRNG